MAKRIGEVLVRLEHVLGFRVKVVERTGTSIRKTLPNTNPWSGQHCSRKDCITCNQDAEEKPACTQRSLVYENICVQCNPEARKKGNLSTINKEVPSVYVGETARSIKERSQENWAAYRSGQTDSHILKIGSTIITRWGSLISL